MVEKSIKESGFCGICCLQGSKYTCPKCNIGYCSLVCYKSIGHADCTEAFYKASFMEGLKLKKSGDQDVKKMEHLLASFEASQSQMDLENNDDEEEEDLEKRLSGVDLESASVDEILACLTIEEKTRFELLLKGDFLQKEMLWTPWWSVESSLSMDEIDVHGDISCMKSPSKIHPKLYNSIVDLLFVYCYTTITMNGEHQGDPVQSTELILVSSYLLQAHPTFTFESPIESLELLLAWSIQSGLGESGFLWILGHVSTLLSHSLFVSKALSDLYCILVSGFQRSRDKSLMRHAKKVQFIARMTMDHAFEPVRLLLLATTSSFKLADQNATKTLIQEL